MKCPWMHTLEDIFVYIADMVGTLLTIMQISANENLTKTTKTIDMLNSFEKIIV